MTHPRDHILRRSFQASSAQTVLANVSLKVRVNGGAATTYTSATSPAILQSADASFVYSIEIPANTYADGDRVEFAWLYSAVAQAGGSEVIGPAEASATEIAAIKAKTDLIGSSGALTLSLIDLNAGTIAIRKGDDYASADGRGITLTYENTSVDFGSATAVFRLRLLRDNTLSTLGTATPSGGAGASKQVVLTMTAAQTDALVTGAKAYEFEVEVTLSGNSRKVTPWRGFLTVLDDFDA